MCMMKSPGMFEVMVVLLFVVLCIDGDRGTVFQ